MSMNSSTDATRASLISRAKSRDSQAWGELVDLYGPLIAHWCYRCGFDSQQVSDSVQDVFVAVANSLSNYQAARKSGSFRSWLWTITSNKIRDAHRRNKNQTRGTGGSTAMMALREIAADAEVPESEPTDEQQISQLVARGLEQVRREFEPRTWDVFRRVVIDQVATSIVAQEFCITPAAVRQTRSRVLRRLRQQLGDLEC